MCEFSQIETDDARGLDNNQLVFRKYHSVKNPKPNMVPSTSFSNPAEQLLRSDIPFLFSTYLGGSDTDVCNDVAVDPEGNIYVAGSTESPDFPVVGGYERIWPTSRDCFVVKFSPNGDIMYSTVIGGMSLDRANAIEVDEFGNVYIAGDTMSIDFPVVNAYQSSHIDTWYTDTFLLKLNSTGNGILYSTYLGGNSFDTITDIALDSTQNVCAVGYTDSLSFPLVNAFDSTHSSQEGFIFKLNTTGNDLIFSSFIGGSNTDEVTAITIDSNNNAYITGYTSDSSDFPLESAFDDSHNGLWDCFIAKVSPNGNLNYSTFIGGTGYDKGSTIGIDALDVIYVAGYTDSSDFPALSALDPLFSGESEGFLLKLSPQGDSLLYSTFLGGSGDDEIQSLSLDQENNVLLIGRTNSSDFPNMTIFDTTFDGGEFDCFVAKVDTNNSAILFSTYIGGNETDIGNSIIYDSVGKLVLIGETSSHDFPCLSESEEYYNGGSSDGFVIKMNDLSDSDNDRLPDWWEIEFGLDPNFNDSSYDSDIDGLSNLQEYRYGTRPNSSDTDFDSMPDGWEVNNNLNPLLNDSMDDPDSDSLSNVDEWRYSTNPWSNDTDDDLMPDDWEINHQLNPISDDSQLDFDNDGLTNLEEYSLCTSPDLVDSDGDLMPDNWEVLYNLNPLFDDSLLDLDTDGLINLFEYGNGTLPTEGDSDSDSMPDLWEIEGGLNPILDDSVLDLDRDEVINIFEYGNGTSPNNNDTDSDSMPDGWELEYGLNPLVDDAAADLDFDGLQNSDEYCLGTLPNNNDTDSDLMPDGWEYLYSFNPLSETDSLSDADSDLLSNVREYELGTNPRHIDTDLDSIPDGWEVLNGFDPKNPQVTIYELLLWYSFPIAIIVLISCCFMLGMAFTFRHQIYATWNREKNESEEGL